MKFAVGVTDVREMCCYAKVVSQFLGTGDKLLYTIQWMISETADYLAMRLRDLFQMGSINHQLAAFVDNPAQFVAGLTTDPHLVVMIVKYRHHALISAIYGFDVHLPANIGSLSECRFDFANIQRTRMQLRPFPD